MSTALTRSLAVYTACLAQFVFTGCARKPSTPEPPKPTRARLVEVIATEYHLNPSVIFAEPGETLTLALRNEGTMPHSLELDLGRSGDQGLSETVAPGETAKVTVAIPMENGNYMYYCPIDGHRGLGMQGTLTV